MEPKLKNISTSYHKFVDNQFLTAKQLNEVSDFFEDQDRLTRVSLTGTGIVCGFDVRLNVSAGKTSVFVTQGTGITTDGDLVKLTESNLKKTQKSISFDEIELTHFRRFEDKQAKYSFFRKKSDDSVNPEIKVMDLWELLPGKTDDAEPLKNLPGIENKVVLIYIDSFIKEADLCTSTDCVNQGDEQVAEIRILLVAEADARLIAGAADTVFNKHNIFETYLSLPHVAVKRILLSGKNVTTPDLLKNIYFDAIKNSNTITSLKTGFDKIFQWFAMPGVSIRIETLFDFTASSIPPDFQYRYDVLKDLADSYNEIRDLLLHINVECLLNIQSFPKHLLLGFTAGKKAFPDLRHRFYHSPVAGYAATNLAEVKSLLERVKIQLDGFVKLSTGNEIRITPSVENGKLGEKAIPFYYNPGTEIRRFWNFRLTQNFLSETNSGYRFSSVSNSLVFEGKQSDFYRIEGHQGKDFSTAAGVISQQIKTNGLDFTFLYFNLDSEASRFQSFVNDISSVAHLSGVPKGGTFVLIGAKSKVVADFCISFRYQKENSINCCRIRECSFPWISTLKYLNNLSRGLSGTVSKKIAVRRNYVLQILDYRINDTLLVNKLVTVSIPVRQILLRRMHAVTDALNKRFPEGVVFDFNESQKRLLVVHGLNDKFLIRFRDVTVKSDSPVYEFNSTGMLKDNKALRADAMICREIMRYNSEFYKKLQTEFAPVNKDDDFGAFDNKWAEWEKIIKALKKKYPKRVVRSITDLPAGILKLTGEVKSKLIKASQNDKLSVLLDGDWVNGAWVDDEMLDYYKRNRQTATDPIVQLINLRKLLHSETGVTKLSVYITNMPYSAVFDGVIAEFEKSVDFYFSTPTGKFAKAL